MDVRAAGDGYDAGVEVTVKDVTQVLRVPVQLQRGDGGIVARGEFPLTQSQLGLKPFSAAMGTLVVLDEMHVRFEVRRTSRKGAARFGRGTVPIFPGRKMGDSPLSLIWSVRQATRRRNKPSTGLHA